MRNIALLEWGPASLFYIQPRERIKVRTEWLEGGPQMPPFLSTMEHAKADGNELCVRYALSAFEDLNSVIRNLRKCFGFPYAEYIGYLNTLTRTHRARREHEGLLPSLRRWAIFGNVDAVVWIDYSKSNQPPGSFKMGPRDSRPFSASHMELCTHVAPGPADRDGEESEVAWSDIDEQEGAAVQAGAAPPPAEVLAPGHGGQMVRWGSTDHHDGSRRPSKTEGGYGGSLGGLRVPVRLRMSQRSSQDSGKSPRHKAANPPEGAVIQTALQEEFIPAFGSIYQRSISPGPGYYGTGDSQLGPDSVTGPSFGRRQKMFMDKMVASLHDVPAPGDYNPKPPMTEVRGKLGCFNRAEKMVSPIDAHKKLPFISALASACEGYGLQSPVDAFTSVNPHAPSHTRGYTHAPKYSFGKSRRPW